MIKVLKTPIITINAIDLSDHISKASMVSTFNQVDITAFGAKLKAIAQGLGDGSCAIDLFEDYDVGSVEHVLWPLSQSGSIFPIVMKPTSATVSDTNPSYTMLVVCADFNPFDGSVGTAQTLSVTFPNADQSGIVRSPSLP
jgi:hypothetical protein